MGQSFEIYNLVTAPQLQINSRFAPYFRLPDQIVPTGTMISELGKPFSIVFSYLKGIKFQSHRLYINSNTTTAQFDGTEISLEDSWEINYGDYTVRNVAGVHLITTIETPELQLSFIRKVYRHEGLEPQYHYDYKAALKNENPNLHGLLGQTWEEKYFEDKSGAFKHLDGVEDDYRIIENKIFSDAFKYNLFQNE